MHSWKSGLLRTARTLRAAAWLGWQIESNWTDPYLFFVFSVLKPVSGVLILVFMYSVVARPGGQPGMYAYIYLGNTFYIYVGAMLAGASFAILDDRERYRTLKYLYIAPLQLPLYLCGRAAARFATGSLAVGVTLLAGTTFFGLPLDPRGVNWPMLMAALLLGLVCLTIMGIIVGTWSMTIQNEPWFLGEAIAGALYLFSGAIFPLSILPAWLQPLGFVLPTAYWLELIRRAVLAKAAFPPFTAMSNAQLFGILAAVTLAYGLLSAIAFRHFDRVAREKGMIDLQSNF